MPAAAAAAPAPAGEQPVLVVSDRGRVQRVPVADILYLKAELKYVTLRTAAHAYVLDDSLSDLEQRLGGAMLRVHRNALVARSAIRKLERRPAGGADAGEGDSESWAVQIGATQEWLAVSRRQLSQVRELLASDGV
jgi:two-component system response regulator AlgR